MRCCARFRRANVKHLVVRDFVVLIRSSTGGFCLPFIVSFLFVFLYLYVHIWFWYVRAFNDNEPTFSVRFAISQFFFSSFPHHHICIKFLFYFAVALFLYKIFSQSVKHGRYIPTYTYLY